MDDPRAILRAHGLRTKKHFGQNFLVDPTIPPRIVAAGGATPSDTVFEIGAGLGTLTRALGVAAGRVVALEHDRELVPVVRSELAGEENITIREGNVLDVDWAALAEELGGPPIVYGNLPYNLSTQIVVGLLEARGCWRRACFMLQKEFAERVAAPPGDRRCGTLSALAALWTWPTLAFHVGAASFHPVPKVDSAVLVLEPRPGPAEDVGDPLVYRQVVRALFSQRRKMARKALKPLWDDPPGLLEVAGLEPTRRGETFTLPELARLSRSLHAARRG